MKQFKKVISVLFLLMIFAGLSIYGYLLYSKPKYEGELSLKNIQKPATVYFDEFGIPHIYAASQNDAMVALGYVHAQDRLWQMELLRRIAPGKLAAIFGSKVIKTDMFFASLGIDEASQKAISEIDKNSKSYQLALSYLDGINQYVKNGKTPVEFTLLGLKKQKFEIKDVYNIFGYMAFSFAMAQKTDPLLTDIRDKYGMEYLKDFGINSEYNFTKLKNFEGKSKQYTNISKSITALLETSQIPVFIGSNSWIIGEPKAKNGKVIFANDPHIAFSQPATWYEAHIATPDYEMYGYYLSGTPFPLLGHNRNYAYGLTMFENDDVDFYKETNNPKNANQYQSPNGFINYELRQKIIKVKDSSDVILKLKISRHGPIINQVIDGISSKNPIAISWIFTQQPIRILDATYALCHAKNVNDFRENVSLIAAPGLNIMYGDARGNIAWTTSGKLYKHKQGVNPNFILDGSSGNEDIHEFLDFSKNPKALNPAWNYLYSANNQPEAVNGFLYPGYYLPEDRAKRINDLLQPKNNWTKQDVANMMLDNTSSTATETVKILLGCIDKKSLSLNERKAYEIMKSWKASSNKNEIAPTIYNKWIYLYLKNTMEDELGSADFKMFMSTHIMKQMINNLVKNPKSPWWDNIQTKNYNETRNQIISYSFKQAVSSLENQLGTDTNSWTWGKVHTLEHKHPMGKIALLKSFFNVGNFQVSGSNEVINNQIFPISENGIYDITAGPSTRRIIDFSDIENSWSILPTGQSGNPMSKHYSDQSKLYNDGKFRKMKLNKQEIIKTSTKLVFYPIKN